MTEHQFKLMAAIDSAARTHLKVQLIEHNDQIVIVGGRKEFEQAVCEIIKQYDISPIQTPKQ